MVFLSAYQGYLLGGIPMNGKNRHLVIRNTLFLCKRIIEFMFYISGHPAEVSFNVRMKR